ncbi:MAG: hypothetical protein ACI4R8_03940 [Candidatus Caccovivens sp.]
MDKKQSIDVTKLTKTQQDCLALIETLGIYELRALARVFGDNSPTTLKRNEHINIVMNKIISGEDLKPIPLRQGRPYKELGNIEGILAELSQITGKDYSIKSNQQRNASQKVVIFKQVEEDILKQKLFPIAVRGILQEKNNKELYLINLDNGKTILVKKDLDSRLKANDYITGTAVVMNEDKEYILDSINTVNYKPLNNYYELKDEYIETTPNKEISLSENSIVLGSRYILQTSKLTDNLSNIKQIVKTLKENNVITIALVPNVLYEDLLTLSSIGFNNAILIRYDERPTYTYDVAVATIGHIRRLQEQGYSVALFVEDVCTIANSIDFAFKNNTKALMGHTETAVDYIKQIIMLAKAGSNDKNTTVFVTFDQVDMFDPMYVSSVYKVSKKINI